MEQEDGVGILIDISVEEKPQPKPRSPDQREIEEQFKQIELSIRKARIESKTKRALAEEAKAKAEENFDDVPLIHEEKFDFDVPCLSLSNSDETEEKTPDADCVVDEDEVFFGPVGYMEKVVSKVVTEATAPEEEPEAPLTGAQFVELFMEAQKVACAIKAESADKSPLKRPVIPALELPEVPPAPRSAGRKRKGTFCLDDSFESESPQPKRHERKGTFTLNDEDPKEEACEEAKEEACEEAKKEIVKPAPGRRSLRVPATRSGIGTGCGIRALKQPPSPVRRPKSPKLKKGSAHSKLQMLKPPGSTKTSPQEKSVGPSPNPHSKIQQPRLSGGLLRPTAGTSGLQPPSNRRSPRLKAPSSLPSKLGIKPLAQQPQKQDPPAKPAAKTISQLAPPSKSKLSQPSAQAASSIPSSQASGVPKPSLKAPMTKLEMLRPNQLQRRSIHGKIPGPRGPMKATERHTAVKDEETSIRAPLQSHVNGTEVSEHRGSYMDSTPVKLEKRVQPKRLMDGLQTPPRKHSDSSNASDTPGSIKQRSFLPTPGRTFTGPRRNSSCSTTSSVDSLASPLLKSGRSPVTRRSLASPLIRGAPAFPAIKRRSLASPIMRGTPTCPTPKGRPKVIHTPLNKENETAPKRSRWSPIQRKKAINREDEIIQCTKRTSLKYQ